MFDDFNDSKLDKLQINLHNYYLKEFLKNNILNFQNTKPKEINTNHYIYKNGKVRVFYDVIYEFNTTICNHTFTLSFISFDNQPISFHACELDSKSNKYYNFILLDENITKFNRDKLCDVFKSVRDEYLIKIPSF